MPHPGGGPPTHWDQSIRYLPAEVAVRSGQTLEVVARHTDHDTQIGVREVDPAALGTLGHVARVLSDERLSVGAATCGTTVHLADASSALAPSLKASSKAVKAAVRDLMDVESLGRTVRYNPPFAVMIVLGQLTADALRSDPKMAGMAELHAKFAALVQTHSLPAITAAIRHLLAPNDAVQELAASSAGARWVLASEILCAARLVSDRRIRTEVLLLLRDKLTLYSREVSNG